MNKADFIEAVADGAELTKADAGRAVDAMIAAVTKALKKGDTVTLV
ncbi:MAG TPA: HU family DNA-binding protein, partial [Thermomonas sp.]